MIDPFGRSIHYARLSVTDLCNLRCRYCMPEEGVDLKSHQQMLRWEEIHRMVKAFADLGVNKVRITGGVDSRTRFSVPVELATGSRKQILLYAQPLGETANQVALALRDDADAPDRTLFLAAAIDGGVALAAENRAGQRVGVDQADGFGVKTSPAQGDVTLDVHSGRAGQPARGVTVRFVVGQKKFKIGLPGFLDGRAFRVHHHAVHHRCGAGPFQAGSSLHFRDTQGTGRERGVVLELTQGGNIGYLMLPDHIEQGFGLVRLDRDPVDFNFCHDLSPQI